MKKERHTLKIAVYAVLMKDDRVLLTRRSNTGWQDGNYSLPAGHLELGETLVEALVRETREEVGVELVASTIKLAHVMHRQHLYIDFFFTAEWNGEPKNLEPEKCDDVQWFSFDVFPENMVPSVRFGLSSIRQDNRFSELEVGYDEKQSPSVVAMAVV